MAGRRPDLLAVQNPLVAIESGLQAQTTQVATGVGFAVALTPHVVTRQDARQVVLLLFFGPPLQDRVAEHDDAEHIVGSTRRNAGLGEFLGQDHLLERRESSTAVGDRPPGSEKSLGVQLLAPLRGEVVHFVVGHATQTGEIGR